MPIARTSWLFRVTVACLAVVSALFIAHLGAEGHSDECHACEIAAHAAAIEAPIASVEASVTQTCVTPPASTPVLASADLASGAPRAPPTT